MQHLVCLQADGRIGGRPRNCQDVVTMVRIDASGWMAVYADMNRNAGCRLGGAMRKGCRKSNSRETGCDCLGVVFMRSVHNACGQGGAT